MGLRTGIDRLAAVLSTLGLMFGAGGVILLFWGFAEWGFGDTNAILGAAIIGGGGYATLTATAWVLRGFASDRD